DAAVLGFGGEGVLKGERAHLLGQSDFMAARGGAERTAAAAENIDPRRAMPRPAGALLAVHFLAGTMDFGAVLDRMSAGAALGELPNNAALNEIGARLQPEDRVRYGDRTGRLPVEGGDFQFHVTHLPGPAPREFQRALRFLRQQRAAPNHPRRCGICPVAAPPWAAPSSRRRAP